MTEPYQKLTAIVFGGAGFIGSHLVASLSESRRYSRIISYDIRQPKLRISEVEYVVGDVRNRISIEGPVQGAEVYNLAAVHTTPGYEDWEYFWTNVLGATNICDFARSIDTTFMLFTSSISVYGPSEEPLDERSHMKPNSAYGRSKLQAEGIHRSWLINGPHRHLVVVRPAVIFGAGEGGNFTRLASLLARGRFLYPGRRDTIKSCGYVAELVRSMEFARALDRPEFTYNFAYPARTTTEQICASFTEVAGFARPKWVMPISAMLAIAFCFEAMSKVGLRTSINRERIYKLVRSTNILPTALEEAGYIFNTDLHSALRHWREESEGTFE